MCIVGHWNVFIYSYSVNTVTPFCRFSFRRAKKNAFLTLALTFVTCVGAVALITAVIEPKGEELESKPSTACESSGPLFSSTHL